MKTITCDFCQEPVPTHVVRELRLYIRSQAYDQPSYPIQDYPLKSYDICAECAAKLRNADKITVEASKDQPPKKVDMNSAKEVIA